jgi:hypothetical protein
MPTRGTDLAMRAPPELYIAGHAASVTRKSPTASGAPLLGFLQLVLAAAVLLSEFNGFS